MNTSIASKDGYTIRLATQQDALNYYQQNYCPLDKDVAYYTGCKEMFTKDEVISFFMKSLEDENRRFFLIVDEKENIIGETVINEIDWTVRSANFRIAVFAQSGRDKGIGSWATRITRDYAFEELHLHRLSLDVFSFNIRAYKAYTKAGFKREGVLRDAVFDGKKYADDILMAILEDEWKELKKLESED
ncbi:MULTISPECIES: GNAT family protein [unclassified Breznakia]|uniref:GNAT family N-acetyltransferase n=1 Tax=unclassified Breznakia TaxID=2623764 RepID=UPI0024764084|nr:MULTISPECIES: GNAT family protein [unclassified Breznakia]MDH6368093.1 RimJ/RimL family protein N-acetyltransferase [Breznakia sp. PH1-1]MDH6405175.1 RimJ/RimL family protein N-acetyltransferase [Breznakia sp. PF1-11]MDH6412896.1 RimJ/RimL family protein N-acetyltransferase [Breznakia sp. PFB1-11]MDH6415251.1 RimJ/RimL family protein N-acetyltransferase [Breznakia sp. PFB1-14]MDH6417567.1 RimJ/RimL family protein N-acetyltransferase [Breznakia sp. PFB1-4]